MPDNLRSEDIVWDDGDIAWDDEKPSPSQSKYSTPQYSPTDDIPPGEIFLAGVGKGMVDLGRGALQRALQAGGAIGAADPRVVEQYQRYIDEANALDRALTDTRAGKAGVVVGNIAATAPIPGGAGGGAIMRALTSAASGGLVGALQPTQTGESALGNAAEGAAFGAAGSGVLTGVGKLWNAITKPVLGGAQQKAKALGLTVPLTRGEAAGNTKLQRFETLQERSPIFSLYKFRQEQQKAAVDDFNGFMSNYIIGGAEYHTKDFPGIMQNNRKYVSALYDKMNAEVASSVKKQNAAQWFRGGFKDAVIDPSETRKTAGALLNRYGDIFNEFQDNFTKNKLTALVSETTEVGKWSHAPQTAPGISGSAQRQIKQVTFNDLWELRQGVGDMIGQAIKKEQSGNISHAQLSQLESVYAAINKDIDNWASRIPDNNIRQAINAANDAYKQYVVKFDLIARQMDNKNVFNNEGLISPLKFSNALRDIVKGNKYGVKFAPEEVSRMAGTAEIMSIIKRAGQYTENPPTGNRWGVPIILTEVAGYAFHANPATVAAGAGVISAAGVARFLNGTESGKRLALAASKVEPESPAMRQIMKQVYRLTAKAPASITAAADPARDHIKDLVDPSADWSR